MLMISDLFHPQTEIISACFNPHSDKIYNGKSVYSCVYIEEFSLAL